MKPLLPIYLLLLSAIISAQPAQNRPFSINGVVLDDKNNPVPGASVRAMPEAFSYSDGVWPLAKTGEDGRFVIGVPRATKYTMTYEKPDTGFPSTYNRFYYPNDEFRPVVIVPDGQKAPTVILRFPAPFGRIGGVRVISEARLSDAQIKLCRIETPKYCFTVRTYEARFRAPLYGIDDAFSVYVTSAEAEDEFFMVPEGIKPGDVKRLSFRLESTLSDKPYDFPEKLPAPDIVFPLEGAQLAGYPRLTRLQWSPVAGAAGYVVDIEVCQGAATSERVCSLGVPLQHYTMDPTSGIIKTSYQFNFVGNQPGRWRIWALGPSGSPGRRSAWMTFYYNN